MNDDNEKSVTEYIPGSDAAAYSMDRLPAVYHDRDSAIDAEHGPLRDFLTVTGEVIEALEDGTSALYDNLFGETADSNALPLIAALTGQSIPTSGGLTRSRADIVDYLRQQRRRGSLPLLEEMAFAVTGWPARASEPFRLLLTTEALNHWPPMERALIGAIAPFLLPERGTICLRDGDAVDRLGTAFDDSAVRTVDLRPATPRRLPRQACPKPPQTPEPAEGNRLQRNAVNLFVFPLQTHVLEEAQAYAVPYSSPDKSGLYLMDLRGFAVPLIIAPSAEPGPSHIADSVNLPGPLRRRALYYDLHDFYGSDKSLNISVFDDTYGWLPVPAADILVTDLSRGADTVHSESPLDITAPRPQGRRVAVDPERGALLLGEEFGDDEPDVRVSYRTPFGPSGLPIGGGGYDRPLTSIGSRKLFVVRGRDETFSDALRAWDEWRSRQPDDKTRRRAVIEIRDSGRHEVLLQNRHGQRIKRIDLGPLDDLEIRAGAGCRPVVTIIGEDGRSNILEFRGLPLSDAAPWTLTAATADDAPPSLPTLRLDGLTIAHCPVWLEQRFGQIEIAHCTLLPRKDSGFFAMVIENADGEVCISRSIVGGIQVNREPNQGRPTAPADALPATDAYRRGSRPARPQTSEGAFAPVTLTITDSVIDSGTGDQHGHGPYSGGCHHVKGNAPVYNALYGAGDRSAFVRACLRRTTVFGAVYVHEMPLAEDCLFIGCVTVARRQRGCVRYCFLSDKSRVPPRYRCQPDIALAALIAQNCDGLTTGPQPSEEQKERTRQSVAPIFVSRQMGQPGYAMLARICPDAVRVGASDQGEMGVFHDAQIYAKEKELMARLRDSLPAGWEAGIFYEYFEAVWRKRNRHR